MAHRHPRRREAPPDSCADVMPPHGKTTLLDSAAWDRQGEPFCTRGEAIIQSDAKGVTLPEIPIGLQVFTFAARGVAMARHRFQDGQEIAGRLDYVRKRPIENGPPSGVVLLRLEFRVHVIVEVRKELQATTMYACRELVVGSAIDATRDAALMAYANALGVGDQPGRPDRWQALQGKQRWLRVVFGPPRGPDYRNPFKRIRPLDPSPYAIRASADPDIPEWATVEQAARALDTSESTVRRMVDELARTWGSDLVYRTRGQHRRIHLPTLMTIRGEP